MKPMILACRYKTDEGECILENKACDGCKDVFPHFATLEEGDEEDMKEFGKYNPPIVYRCLSCDAAIRKDDKYYKLNVKGQPFIFCAQCVELSDHIAYPTDLRVFHGKEIRFISSEGLKKIPNGRFNYVCQDEDIKGDLYDIIEDVKANIYYCTIIKKEGAENG